MSWTGSNALVWDLDRLRIATDAAGVALWSWNIDTDEIALDERARDLWGVHGCQVTFEDLSARMHPADLDRVRQSFKATQAIPGSYEIDFRIERDDQVRWISARGQGGNKGIVGRILFAVFIDVTERKQAEEMREMLAGEMSHRVKNLFAIASALTTIAARSTTTTTEMARDLTQRLSALGRAHDLVRPVPGREENKAALLCDLLVILLAPYVDDDAGVARIHVSGPDLRVGDGAITAMALIIHELATNSVKYGALSCPGGTIGIVCSMSKADATITWTERGGPRVDGPRLPGYGSKLIARTMDGLGGSIQVEWPTAGVVATLRMTRARLSS